MTGRPHVDQGDRDLLDDHGLIDHAPAGDDIETRNAPGWCWNTAEGLSNRSNR